MACQFSPLRNSKKSRHNTSFQSPFSPRVDAAPGRTRRVARPACGRGHHDERSLSSSDVL